MGVESLLNGIVIDFWTFSAFPHLLRHMKKFDIIKNIALLIKI